MHVLRLGVLLSASMVTAAGCGDSLPDDGATFDTDVSALSSWSVRELGPGWAPSLVMDPKGFPLVSVAQGVPDPTYDGGNIKAVLFANDGGWRSGAGWTSANVNTGDNVWLSTDPSLALLGSTPQIAYIRRPDQRFAPTHMKLATENGNSPGWQVETLNDEGTIFQAVQRTLDDSTWVVYQDPNLHTERLRIATTVSGTWETHELAIPLALTSSLDAAVGESKDGKPVVGIATTNLGGTGSASGLRFATSLDGGESWEPVVHIDNTWGMIGPQIAYSGENPMITYTEVDAKKAKFAYSKDGGESWDYETIATFHTNPATGLAIDPRNGEPVVAIVANDLDVFETRLYVARRGFMGTWSLELVDSASLGMNYRFAVNPRIAINDKGEVAVAWQRYQGSDRRVRIAWDAAPVVGPGPRASE